MKCAFRHAHGTWRESVSMSMSRKNKHSVYGPCCHSLVFCTKNNKGVFEFNAMFLVKQTYATDFLDARVVFLYHEKNG